jgi:hypothetical protein
MQFSLLPALLVTMTTFLSFVFAHPQFQWDGFVSYPKAGEPIVEGSRCTEGQTQCPAGTKCGDLYLSPDPVLRYYINPARPNLRSLFNCKKDSDCGGGFSCGITPPERGGYCKSNRCQCNTNDMFLGCMSGTPICELFKNKGGRFRL